MAPRTAIAAREDGASSQPRRADDLAVRCLEDDSNVLAVREWLVDVQRRSVPVADFAYRANHIGFLQRPTAVLAAPDRGLMVVIEADQQHRCLTPAAADIDGKLAAFILGDLGRGGGLAVPFGIFDRSADVRALRADMAGRAIDHHL